MPEADAKLIEGIENRGNGALIRSTVILWTNDQYFVLLRSIGVYGKTSPVEHLRIYILRPCRHAPLYRPMLIFAGLTGVTVLGFNIPQWFSSPGSVGSRVVRQTNADGSRTVGRVVRSSSSWWPDREEMDNHDCTMTHSGLLIWRRAASCSVATSHTSLDRCLTSPNETGSHDTTTRWWLPARRSRKSRMRAGDACRLQCRRRQSISLMYSNTTISLAFICLTI